MMTVSGTGQLSQLRKPSSPATSARTRVSAGGGGGRLAWRARSVRCRVASRWRTAAGMGRTRGAATGGGG